jgi:hypothetical protein
MPDEIDLHHRHPDTERRMAPGEDSRVDGLRVRQYECDCGYAAAVLSPVDEEEQGQSWPYRLVRPNRPS